MLRAKPLQASLPQMYHMNLFIVDNKLNNNNYKNNIINNNV